MDHNEQTSALSVRSRNVVQRLGAHTFGDLAQFTEEEVLSTRCFGMTSLKEIREVLAQHGLKFGMSREQIEKAPGAREPILKGEPEGAETDGIDHEEACCEHCQKSAQKLRERIKS